jgi:hypothetical protein
MKILEGKSYSYYNKINNITVSYSYNSHVSYHL